MSAKGPRRGPAAPLDLTLLLDDRDQFPLPHVGTAQPPALTPRCWQTACLWAPPRPMTPFWLERERRNLSLARLGVAGREIQQPVVQQADASAHRGVSCPARTATWGLALPCAMWRPQTDPWLRWHRQLLRAGKRGLWRSGHGREAPSEPGPHTSENQHEAGAAPRRARGERGGGRRVLTFRLLKLLQQAGQVGGFNACGGEKSRDSALVCAPSTSLLRDLTDVAPQAHGAGPPHLPGHGQPAHRSR